MPELTVCEAVCEACTLQLYYLSGPGICHFNDLSPKVGGLLLSLLNSGVLILLFSSVRLQASVPLPSPQLPSAVSCSRIPHPSTPSFPRTQPHLLSFLPESGSREEEAGGWVLQEFPDRRGSWSRSALPTVPHNLPQPSARPVPRDLIPHSATE